MYFHLCQTCSQRLGTPEFSEGRSWGLPLLMVVRLKGQICQSCASCEEWQLRRCVPCGGHSLGYLFRAHRRASAMSWCRNVFVFFLRLKMDDFAEHLLVSQTRVSYDVKSLEEQSVVHVVDFFPASGAHSGRCWFHAGLQCYVVAWYSSCGVNLSILLVARLWGLRWILGGAVRDRLRLERETTRN